MTPFYRPFVASLCLPFVAILCLPFVAIICCHFVFALLFFFCQLVCHLLLSCVCYFCQLVCHLLPACVCHLLPGVPEAVECGNDFGQESAGDGRRFQQWGGLCGCVRPEWQISPLPGQGRHGPWSCFSKLSFSQLCLSCHPMCVGVWVCVVLL